MTGIVKRDNLGQINGDEWLRKSFDRSSTEPQAHSTTGQWEIRFSIIKREIASVAH